MRVIPTSFLRDAEGDRAHPESPREGVAVSRRRWLGAGLLAATGFLAGCTSTRGRGPAPEGRPVTGPPVAPSAEAQPRARVGLALGGGAARGFAHVGVIRALEQAGIVPDVIAGTSAGAVVGALYAAGYTAGDLLRIAGQLEQSSVRDLTLPDRGFIRGERLQAFVNRAVQDRPIERLRIRFAAVATDLATGEAVTFRSGDTGLAVRASSAVPGVFQPVVVGGRTLVDGGLTHPVPVAAARALGADVVIAVDISRPPETGRFADSIDVILQTFSIMGKAIAAQALREADVVIRPPIGAVGSTDFDSRQFAIAEGERATRALLPEIRRRIDAASQRLG